MVFAPLYSSPLARFLSIAKWSSENFYVHESGLRTPCLHLPTKPHKYTGYARFYVNGKSELAHIYFWTEIFGKPPKRDANGELMHLDHLCRNRRCCWIGHLELVPMSVNLARGTIPPSWRVAETGRCMADLHDMTDENTHILGNGNKMCHACKLDSQRKRSAKHPRRKSMDRKETWKLTPDHIRDIWNRLHGGETRKALADEYGVTYRTIRLIDIGELGQRFTLELAHAIDLSSSS